VLPEEDLVPELLEELDLEGVTVDLLPELLRGE